jgi:hypothetical protein
VKSDAPVREYKAMTGTGRAVARRAARDRPGLPRVESCSVCRRPVAALIGGGLGANESLICSECVDAMYDALDQHLATISPEDLGEAAEMTTEEEYEAALDREHEWHLGPDGALLDGPPDEWAPWRR